MIEIIKGLPNNVVGIAVEGRVTKKDCYDVLMPAMEKSLKRNDKIRLYYELNSRFPGAAWDDLNVGIEHIAPCERVAIVTDVGWIRYTVKALRFSIPGEIQVFATVQASEGRAWITAAPGSPASAEASAPARRRLSRSRRPRLRSAMRWSRGCRDARSTRHGLAVQVPGGVAQHRHNNDQTEE
jgi:SpoIIAA-like